MNKLNTKATLRFSLTKSQIHSYFPRLVLSHIKSSPHTSRFVTKTDDLLVQADGSRKQADNVEECFQKLWEAVVRAVDLRGETSEEQRGKVVKL